MDVQRLIEISGWCYFNQKEFNFWYDGTSTNGIPFGINKLSDGSFEVAFQGSDSSIAWLRDFDIMPTEDTVLGYINAGQAIGLQTVLDVITGIIDKDKPVYVSGHSKGGGMAILAGGRLIILGYDVRVAAFEPPQTQFHTSITLSNIYAGHEILITKNVYDGKEDAVPNEPPDYLHPAPVTEISCPPFSLDMEGSMSLHHWQLVFIGVYFWLKGKLCPQ